MKKVVCLIGCQIALCLTLSSCLIEQFQSAKVGNNAQPNSANSLEPSGKFVDGSGDIPLLAEMTKISDENIDFDSTSGSISSSKYQTKIEVEKIRTFYLKTLPQLGWKLVLNNMKKAIFERKKERLELGFMKSDEGNVVEFFISSSI